MFTTRGFAVLATALGLWLASRILGTPDLHIVAVGLFVLPLLAAALVRLRRPMLGVTRRLSTRRVFPGTKVRVDLELRNDAPSATPLLMLEDRLPAPLGGGARAVVSSVPSHERRTASYTFVPRARGRYRIGPLVANAADPFDLSRRAQEVPGTQELLVYPSIEELDGSRAAPPAAGTGETPSRRLFRSGEEFYTMRPYQTGDDLRRIHWPSTARMGDLMIRQHEAARRSSVVLLLDTRVGALGARPELFERGVSAAASVGWHYLRSGYGLHLATPDLRPQPQSLDTFMATLAVVSPSRERQISPALRRTAEHAAGALFVVVTHLPVPEETSVLSSASGATRLAILLAGRGAPSHGSEAHAWEQAARAALTRAGWDVLLLRPEDPLASTWQRQLTSPTIASRAGS